MNISELLILVKWIDKEIKESKIVELYQSLHTILHANSQPNQALQPLEAQKEELFEAIRSVSLDFLTLEQVEFLKELGIFQCIRTEGINDLEDILFKNSLDSVTAAEKVNEKIQNLQAAISKSDQIQSGLEGLDIPEKDLDNEALIRISFTEDASIANVVDLKKWSAVWHDIGRGVAVINNTTPQEVRVIGAGRGSIVIELAVGYAVARTLTDIILLALKVAKKILDIRQQAEKIRGMELKNNKIAQDLESEAEVEKKKGIDEIEHIIVKNLGKKNKNQGDKIIELKRAVVKLVDFIQKGGVVDCILPESEDAEDEEGKNKDTKELHQLRGQVKEIRKIENTLKLIEHIEDDSSTEGEEDAEEESDEAEGDTAS